MTSNASAPNTLLRRARLAKGLTAAAVAKAARVGHSYLIAVERGRRTFPSPSVLDRILVAMDAAGPIREEILFSAALHAGAAYQDSIGRKEARAISLEWLVGQVRRLPPDSQRTVAWLVSQLTLAQSVRAALKHEEADM
jgi:transcriptional regulator with XRE-family HTH domain